MLPLVTKGKIQKYFGIYNPKGDANIESGARSMLLAVADIKGLDIPIIVKHQK